MAITGISEDKRLEATASALNEMNALAHRMRQLIVTLPPRDLLGYIYGQRMLSAFRGSEGELRSKLADNARDLIDDTQFLLEYVHGVLASTPASDETSFDETTCAELFACSRKLKTTAMLYAMMSSAGTEDGAFGSDTADVEFQAKSTWVLLRGNRHQVLEREFYAFVLAPHDAILREVYGLGANEIASGFQDMTDAVRTGQSDAFEVLARQFDAAQALAGTQEKEFGEVTADWAKDHAVDMKDAAVAFDDMLRGGICNVSRHTMLPELLLADLAFERGEETEFFDDSPFSGTPFKTLPARKKPLIKLDAGYYAVDPCFTRDAGYRALLWNLLRKRPQYKKAFEAHQKIMSEGAFFEILSSQLRGATVHQEVYYKDPVTKQWVENDTLILIEDVLMLVEAKAGAAATIASPALDFERHVQAVQDLVVKAYKQCKRFFDYLDSADEVPIFKRTNDRYVECGRLRRHIYRVMLPIGLTVESFSPFSAMCKELPDVVPLLGKHPFLSLAIDDLFVLKRFLSTMGELAHYLEVRQAVAGMKGVHLFDELDHLGAYIKKNRFDHDILEQQTRSSPTMIIWDGMSDVVDRHFSEEDWNVRPVPTQDFPTEILKLLGALESTRSPGWLSADSYIRNYGEQGRNDLANMLATCRTTLNDFPSRYFSFFGEPSLFIWLQRAGAPHDPVTMNDKASAVALAAKAPDMIALHLTAEPSGAYNAGRRFVAKVPVARNETNARIYEDSERMLRRQTPTATATAKQRTAATRRLGRNERCWCGSNLKFKKCHGR